MSRCPHDQWQRARRAHLAAAPGAKPRRRSNPRTIGDRIICPDHGVMRWRLPCGKRVCGWCLARERAPVALPRTA